MRRDDEAGEGKGKGEGEKTDETYARVKLGILSCIRCVFRSNRSPSQTCSPKNGAAI